jgi:hypothetical protein
VTAKGIIHERPPHSGNFFDEAWVPIKTPTSEANVESDDVKAALDQVIHSTSKPVKTKGK